MKTKHTTNWIRIALLCLALVLVVILLTIPLLAKGISQIVGNPREPEKLDLRPIPVPVPAPPLAANQPAVSATPFPSLLVMGLVPQPISVPTLSIQATQTAASLVERQMSESSPSVTVQLANRQDIIAMMLVAIMLLNLVWLHRLPSLHSSTKEKAC